MSAPVTFNTVPARGGYSIGHAELDVPETLNSLSLEMVRLLHPALDEWAANPDIAAVVITAAGDRAFCAGGDIQALYRAIEANHAADTVVNDYPFRFFEEEYRLDYAIHQFPKPVITVGHGIVMGGGLGIFGASEFRVVTEKSRLAVPEITIGLFPDAGGTWTLGRMPGHWASFLGLTGSQINAADALLVGLATHSVGHEDRGRVLAALSEVTFGGDEQDSELVVEQLNRLTAETLPEAQINAVAEREVYFDDFQREIAATLALSGASDWVDKGLGNLNAGCPTTAGIVVEQLRRVPDLSLADSYRLELTVATHCATFGDFREGVRALLIDKDNAPEWRFGNLDNLEWEHVLAHFEDPWTAHPLADLGT